MNDMDDWKVIIIPGDKALAKILNVHYKTVENWRKRGYITAKPISIDKNGKPYLYAYNWEQLKEEIRKNVKFYKVQGI